MQRSSPFSRFHAIMGAIAGAMAMTAASGASISRQEAMDGMTYTSRGKGQGSSNRRAPGAGMASIRAARKARNVKRHRQACR